MKYRFESYKIQIRGEDGKPSAESITGLVVGPFGVAENPTRVDYEDGTHGFYHKVTHLHSGLCIFQLGNESLDSAVSACKELAEAAPWWKSHKISRIESESRLEQGELKSIVLDIARRHNCIDFQ